MGRLSEVAPGLVGLLGYTEKASALDLGTGFGSETGGERGIRTLDAFRHTRFPGVLLRPLGHLTRY